MRDEFNRLFKTSTAAFSGYNGDGGVMILAPSRIPPKFISFLVMKQCYLGAHSCLIIGNIELLV